MSEEATPGQKESVYAAHNAPTLRVPLKNGMIQFENGVYRTSDPEVIEELDNLLLSPSFSRSVRKVDFAAAEAMVKQHQAERRDAGIVGPTSSHSVMQMQSLALKKRDEALLSHGAESYNEALEEAEKGGLSLTQSVETGISENPEDDPIINPPEESEPTKAQKKTLSDLGKK